MATSDIFTLKTSMAERSIRLLYTIALILIAIGVLMGLGRGVMILTHAPMHRPAMTASATPPSSTVAPQAPQTDTQSMRPDMRFGARGGFRGWHRFHHHRFGMMGRSPTMFGIFMIVGALIKGLIALLLVRVLAEIGLAVLAIPRRAAV
jgi:hypothetical protein